MLLEDVCKTHGVRLVSYQDGNDLIKTLGMEDASARTTVLVGYADGAPFILFDRSRPELEILFPIAHGLGHILMGHLTFKNWFCWEMDDVSERTADAFAVHLLASELARRYGADS